MKVARLYSFNDIRIEEAAVPEIGPHDALMRTKACGICSGDVMPWYIEKKAPLVPGHEPTGEVVAVGSEVTSFKKGDRVFVHHHAPCFSCRFCRRGDYVQCDTWKGTNLVPGGISEFIRIPQTNLENDTLTLPEDLSYEDGTLIEPVACCIKGLKRAHVRRGDTVLVIGLGIMGQLNVILSRRYGAAKVIGADRVPFRMNKARDFGADNVIDVSKFALLDALRDLTEEYMADIVIVGPNNVHAMEDGIAATGAGGTVLFFTPARPGEQLTVNPNDLYFKDINIVTSYSCGPTDTADALEVIEEGIIRAEGLVTHRFPVEKTEEAFRLTAQAGDSLKSLVLFD